MVKAILLKSIIFLITLFIFYTFTILFLTFEFKNHSLIARITGHHIKAGVGDSYTLQRYRNIKQFKNIDIIFLGSSHCYRSFDPRIFSKAGLHTFNMGSKGQTPLNSYHILKKYWDEINPELVIFEVFPHLLQNDGFKSFVDLTRNTAFSIENIIMGLKTKNVNAVNIILAIFLRRIFHPLHQENQIIYSSDTYIHGGFVEKNVRVNSPIMDQMELNLRKNMQIDYLLKIINLVKRKNKRIILVTHPLPNKTIQKLTNYNTIKAKIIKICDREKIPYINFNEELKLDGNLHFFDWHHLNTEGVKIFNQKLLLMLNNYIKRD